jgi:hypothetical protein
MAAAAMIETSLDHSFASIDALHKERATAHRGGPFDVCPLVVIMGSIIAMVIMGSIIAMVIMG